MVGNFRRDLFLDVLKRPFSLKINSTPDCSSKINSASKNNNPTFRDPVAYSSSL